MSKLRTLLIGLVLTACAGPASITNIDEITSGSVEIRIRNATSLDFQSVFVQFPDQSQQYGALRPGMNSAYRAVGRAYAYAYVRAIANGREYIVQPIDFFGEELLEPGRYTYKLIRISNERWMGIELIRN